MFGIYPHIEINIDHEKNKDGGLCGKNHTHMKLMLSIVELLICFDGLI